MDTKEFKEKFISDCRKFGLIESHSSNIENPSFYWNTHSTLNQIVNGWECIDFEGETIWITIPCQVKGYEDYFFQIMVRTYGKITPHSNPEFDLNSFVCELFFIKRNTWTNIKVVPFNVKNENLHEHHNKPMIERYMKPLYAPENITHYDCQENFFENYIMDIIFSCNAFLMDEDNLKVFDLMKNTSSRKKMVDLFNIHLKEDFKKLFGEFFKIR